MVNQCPQASPSNLEQAAGAINSEVEKSWCNLCVCIEPNLLANFLAKVSYYARNITPNLTPNSYAELLM